MIECSIMLESRNDINKSIRLTWSSFDFLDFDSPKMDVSASSTESLCLRFLLLVKAERFSSDAAAEREDDEESEDGCLTCFIISFGILLD